MKSRIVSCLFSAVAICTLAAPVFGTPRTVILHVEPAALAWGESQLAEKVTRQLSRSADLRLISNDDDADGLPPFPSATYDVDSLLDWGREVGGQFLLVIKVENERLETKKTFSIPLIVHKWEKVGVIEGEVRLLDLGRGRLLWAEPFREEIRGKQIIQADPDHNSDDPDLHLPAPSKRDLFSRLEDKLADHLARKTMSLARVR